MNEEIERLRLSTMSSLFARRDVIVVASVSCIYGIGSREDYEEMVLPLRAGRSLTREQLLGRLVDLQYNRNDIAFERGQFRVRGDTVELCPAYSEDALRIEFFGDEVERLTRFDPLDGRRAGGAAGGDDLPGEAVRDAGRQDQAARCSPSARSWGSGSPGSRRGASCSKRSGSRCGPSTTSR